MKKIILLLILFFAPFSIKASSSQITSVTLDGVNTITVGKEFSQGVYVKFSNIKKGSADTLGLYLVVYEIDYDESILTLEDVKDNEGTWKSSVYKEDGKTYIISYFDKDPFHNACIDDTLYCADFYGSIKFYVKDTAKASTSIKINEIEAGLFEVSTSPNPEYDIDDMIEVDYSKSIEKTFTIKKDENVQVKEVESVIINSKPSTSSLTKPTTSNTTTNNKSVSLSNNLKSLEVKNYSLSFDKEKTSYDLTIEKNLNTLEVTAVAEDDKATIEIKGNDDLKANNYKVTINVKAQNGDEKIYTINVNQLNKKQDFADKSKKTDMKDIKKITIIGVSLLLLFIVSGIIYNIVNNKKIDRKLDL